MLAADDEAGIRDLLTRLVADAGGSCCAEATGEEGLELLRGGTRFRVLFTGIDRARIAQEATLRAKVSCFLVKPVRLAEVRRVLGDAPRPASAAGPAHAARGVQEYQKQSRRRELEEALVQVMAPLGRR